MPLRKVVILVARVRLMCTKCGQGGGGRGRSRDRRVGNLSRAGDRGSDVRVAILKAAKHLLLLSGI